MTADPLSHERPRRPLGRGSERTEGEFVFTVVVNSPARNEEATPVEHSIRIDPTDGQADELILEITETHGPGTRGRKSFRVSIPSSGVGNPPRIQDVEAALKAWYHRHDTPTAVEDTSTAEGTA